MLCLDGAFVRSENMDIEDQNTLNRPEAFELWCDTQGSMNRKEDKRRSASDGEKGKRAAARYVKRRKMEYFGHTMRGPKYILLQNTMMKK